MIADGHFSFIQFYYFINDLFYRLLIILIIINLSIKCLLEKRKSEKRYRNNTKIISKEEGREI